MRAKRHLLNSKSQKKIDFQLMLQQIVEKQKRVEQRKLENEEQVSFKFKLRNEEENLKQKEREMKLLRQKKRMEIGTGIILFLLKLYY